MRGGIVALMGAAASAYEKRVQVGGEVIRVPIRSAQREFDKGGDFQKAVHSWRYRGSLIRLRTHSGIDGIRSSSDLHAGC